MTELRVVEKQSECEAWFIELLADRRLPHTRGVVDFLKRDQGTRYCDYCLATRMPIQRTDLFEALKAVEYMSLFSREIGRCFFCGSEREITGFLLKF
jgi:hypothetical protein